MKYPKRRNRSPMLREPPTAIAPESAARLRELFDPSRIDFDLLHRQRVTLSQILDRLAHSNFTTSREDKNLTGILHLLDALQDAASDSGVWKYPGARCAPAVISTSGEGSSHD